MSAAKIRSELKKRSSREKAKVLTRFFKTGPGEYGEGDVFMGVTVPNIRQSVKPYRDLSATEVTKLVRSKIHEERLAGLLVLVMQYEKGDDKQRQAVYKRYCANLRYVNNWDLVDLSAHKIIGPHLAERSKAPLTKWARSKNLWERRVAIISTYAYIREHQFDETLRISKILLKDEHDLIHKAVGWMLREVGNRNMAVEERFLKPRYKTMPRTMLRYAIEKFPETKRKRYLQGKV